MRSQIKRKFLMNHNDFILLLFVMLGVFIIFTTVNPSVFLSRGMLSSIAFQFPILGLLTLAMMFAMVSGGIDLSVVSTANLSAIIASLVMVNFLPANASAGMTLIFILLGIVCAIIAGCLAGALNGFLVSVVGIPAIVATLGTMQLYMGAALAITKGQSIVGLPSGFSFVGRGIILGIPVPFIAFLLLVVFSIIMLNLRHYGMRLQMTGSNQEASNFTGINVTNITFKAYIISGFLSSIAGLIMASSANAAQADFGSTYLLQAILIAVMGGVDPYGGRGKVANVVVAVITMQVLSSGLGMLQLSNFFKDFMWGVVLIIVLMMNYFFNRK